MYMYIEVPHATKSSTMHYMLVGLRRKQDVERLL